METKIKTEVDKEINTQTGRNRDTGQAKDGDGAVLRSLGDSAEGNIIITKGPSLD